MKPWQVSIETKDDGSSMAWAFEMPGASGQGADENDALRDLQRTLEWLAGWRRRHHLAPIERAGIEVAESVTATGYPNTGDTEGFFQEDALPLTDEYAEECVQILTFSRADLLPIAQALPPSEKLTWTLMHIAKAEWWYASRIPGSPGDIEQFPTTSDSRACLRLSREMFVTRHVPYVLSVLPRERRHIADGEEWTARKTLRRAVWHELYHLQRMEQAAGSGSGTRGTDTSP
ncbi:MAG: hypothetical protein HRF45_03895 [Fimbriimonadia bacterium]|jgi:hypothetical protein